MSRRLIIPNFYLTTLQLFECLVRQYGHCVNAYNDVINVRCAVFKFNLKNCAKNGNKRWWRRLGLSYQVVMTLTLTPTFLNQKSCTNNFATGIRTWFIFKPRFAYWWWITANQLKEKRPGEAFCFLYLSILFVLFLLGNAINASCKMLASLFPNLVTVY